MLLKSLSDPVELGGSADCLALSSCTIGRLLSLQWWDVGLMPLSCILPRDLSFTMEFWVSLKCSVLILPSLSSATTSSLSPSFPLDFPMSDCLLLVLPTAHLCSHLLWLQRDLNLHWLHLPCTDLSLFLPRGLVLFPG